MPRPARARRRCMAADGPSRLISHTLPAHKGAGLLASFSLAGRRARPCRRCFTCTPASTHYRAERLAAGRHATRPAQTRRAQLCEPPRSARQMNGRRAAGALPLAAMNIDIQEADFSASQHLMIIEALRDDYLRFTISTDSGSLKRHTRPGSLIIAPRRLEMMILLMRRCGVEHFAPTFCYYQYCISFGL